MQEKIDEVRERFISLGAKSTIMWLRARPDLASELIAHTGSKSLSEAVYLIVYTDTTAACPVCGKRKLFNKINKGFFATCGRDECKRISRVESTKRTSAERYANGHHTRDKIFRERMRAESLKRTGYAHPWADPVIRAKAADTMVERYGAKSSLETSAGKVKKIATEKVRYGGTFNNREKARDTCTAKYGVDNAAKLPETVDRARVTAQARNLEELNDRITSMQINVLPYTDGRRYRYTCDRCGETGELSNSAFNARVRAGITPCRECEPGAPDMRSLAETSIANFIESMYSGPIVRNYHKGTWHELDIYMPDAGIAIEHNGVWWHNELFKDKNHHVRKKDHYASRGINVMFVWEDAWKYREQACRSRIMHALGCTTRRIGARQCSVDECSTAEANKLLERWHVQGPAKASAAYALRIEGVAVAVMTFGRRGIGGRSRDFDYELMRFATDPVFSVAGAASRLFAAFVRDRNPRSVLSYADRDWSVSGGVYGSMGFVGTGATPPNYWYVVGDRRVHRYAYRKDRLVADGYDGSMTEHEIMLSRKIYRAYDCGSLAFEWKSPHYHDI